MNPSIKQIAGLYEVNGLLVWKSVADVDSSDLSVRPEDKANSLHWQVGHLTTSRYHIANILGLSAKPAWGEVFERGKEPAKTEQLPKLAELKTAWDNITTDMMRRLEEITEDELSGDAPWQVPVSEQTVRGAVSFMSLHETYHVGQMAYIRRLLGYERLVG
jgi:uncharacterized damage-inducible protein DinB